VSHKYAHQVGSSFQLLLNDVLLGKSANRYPCDTTQFDSYYNSTHNIYVVYKEEYSYPLYLITYEKKKGQLLTSSNPVKIPEAFYQNSGIEQNDANLTVLKRIEKELETINSYLVGTGINIAFHDKNRRILHALMPG